MPTFDDAKTAKNYLKSEELRAMEILGEQWLLYAEGMAQRGKTVSMARLLNKLDELIAVNEYPTFPGYGGSGQPRRCRCSREVSTGAIQGSAKPPPLAQMQKGSAGASPRSQFREETPKEGRPLRGRGDCRTSRQSLSRRWRAGGSRQWWHPHDRQFLPDGPESLWHAVVDLTSEDETVHAIEVARNDDAKVM